MNRMWDRYKEEDELEKGLPRFVICVWSLCSIVAELDIRAPEKCRGAWIVPNVMESMDGTR